MNQVEFIKKWAKEGDRIVDEANIYRVFKTERDEELFFQIFLPFGNTTLKINLAEWRSPKIYRLDEKTEECFSLKRNIIGYQETWSLIADYIDEKAKEVLQDLTFEDKVKSAFNDFDSRLKALEDKIK